MTSKEVDIAYEAEEFFGALDSWDVETQHTLHDGVYSRTIIMLAGQALVGALIKVPTTLIINGCIKVTIGSDIKQVDGVCVIAASANRKQVMAATSDTSVTMVFKTNAKTVEEAEDEFTDESFKLASRLKGAINHVNITGEV